ncbi:16596_t:CDS:2 [Cetraspora pellucida]|uniref:16596_t:CDS:1 n=1 Tax=Cetraspora pellucida TaxID=1433469 RepID=A0A9N9J4X2_9GLOM|nr:16596_t:CDS:2 [Cetraspora pellucida]
MKINIATIDLHHTVLHKCPDRFNISDNIKVEIKNIYQMPADIFKQLEQQHPNLTQKQVHIWWTYFLRKEYLRDDNQLIFTKILVEENKCKVILINNQYIQYLGFIILFFELLKNNKEIVIDATYKTTALEVTNSINDNDTKSMQIFKKYNAVISDALKIVQEQENANNIQWAQSVQESFKGIQNLVTDI